MYIKGSMRTVLGDNKSARSRVMEKPLFFPLSAATTGYLLFIVHLLLGVAACNGKSLLFPLRRGAACAQRCALEHAAITRNGKIPSFFH